MTYQQAQQHLHRNPGTTLDLVTKDATGSHYVRYPVWLDEDGDMVQMHPTNSKAGSTCAAPRDGVYR